ncbi:MAG: hypothetical protein DWQ04_29565 [Chloroflexi bacterium]|nr:MAG: hypothetical protein DWQ04_29565 [Chloroflexota bacterium]
MLNRTRCLFLLSVFLLFTATCQRTAIQTAVSITPQNDNAVGTTQSFITEFGNPQHLLVIHDKTLLVSDYRNGVIYKFTQNYINQKVF